MRFEQTYIQKAKLGCHFAQAVLILVSGCLSLAILTEDSPTGLSIALTIGLCVLSVPALIYQIVVPTWSRAWKLANVYAYAALDILLALLWLAAVALVAYWEANGTRDGVKGGNNEDGGADCSRSAYGSTSQCEMSKAVVGIGAVLFLLFTSTSAISVHGVIKFRETGIMPNGSSWVHGQVEQLVEDPSKDAWSANADELDLSDLSYRGNDDDAGRTYRQSHADDVRQGLLDGQSGEEDSFLHANDMTDTLTEDGVHPGRPVSYQSSKKLSITPPPFYGEDAEDGQETSTSPSGYVAPTALSPHGYEETPGGRIHFPHSNYRAEFR